MKARFVFLFAALLGLGSCSYTYEVRAELIDGQLVFTSDKTWFRERCVREIDVVALDRSEAANAEPGDDSARVGYGTYWSERTDYECNERFPITYGNPFEGRPAPHHESTIQVSPKQLGVDVWYEVTTVTGATGYGNGEFRLLSDGTIENR